MPTIRIDTSGIGERKSGLAAAFCCRFVAPVDLHQIATLSANCGQSQLARERMEQGRRVKYGGNKKLAYRMIAERENVKVNSERESRLLIVTKARVFSSEGWKVVVTDGEGKSYQPEEFEKLLAA
jgi:hypothetical protein